MAGLTCKQCKKPVGIKDDYCPHCGAKEPGMSFLSGTIVTIVISAAVWFFNYPIIAGIILFCGIAYSISLLIKSKPKTESRPPLPPTENNTFAERYADDLSIVWADSLHDIEFSYIDSNGRRSKRSVQLSEISVNDRFEPYFVGICDRRNEKRHFKASRIASQIKCNNTLYDIEPFLKTILNLEPELIIKLTKAIAAEEL